MYKINFDINKLDQILKRLIRDKLRIIKYKRIVKSQLIQKHGGKQDVKSFESETCDNSVQAAKEKS